MNRNELLKAVAIKASKEHTEAEIDDLFRPRTSYELLLRIDPAGAKRVVWDGITNNSPSAIPHRFRGPYVAEALRVEDREEVYQAIKSTFVKT